MRSTELDWTDRFPDVEILYLNTAYAVLDDMVVAWGRDQHHAGWHLTAWGQITDDILLTASAVNVTSIQLATAVRLLQRTAARAPWKCGDWLGLWKHYSLERVDYYTVKAVRLAAFSTVKRYWYRRLCEKHNQVETLEGIQQICDQPVGKLAKRIVADTGNHLMADLLNKLFDPDRPVCVEGLRRKARKP